MFMPDLSDVGPPATGPGLPQRVAEAPPPTVRIFIEHRDGCEVVDSLIREILLVTPEADISTEVGSDDAFEIKINDKLMFSKKKLGTYPSNEEIAEIVKWGNKGKSFLHLNLCSVAEGGEPRMVITDRKNTPLPKRVIMSCTIS
ncbi:uncharacterized protein LOC111713624 [Eurytemora carolleeae]|uniref:uncharacterized protein LOC111713624 n=1 Tax=Eurytemora carolleeae TaxID=1294199 RepID=UPI000C76F6C9|nr:uncharacterized protein LOC111713624 [Eurytemora carolleeae]|eukprot:XP_023344302.1 uncharacterized protein LOC111713624 [Eurytemora affinis]